MNIHSEKGWDESLALLKGLNARKKAAFEHLYNMGYRELFRFSCKLVGDEFAADIIVDDVFLALKDDRQRFPSILAIKKFLYAKVRYASLNYLEASARESNNKQEMLYIADKNADPVVTRIIEAEFMGLIYAEIEKLPGRRKDVMKLVYIDNLTTEEIAKILGVTEQTVRNTKADAVAQLRNRLFSKGIVPLLLIKYFID